MQVRYMKLDDSKQRTREKFCPDCDCYIPVRFNHCPACGRSAFTTAEEPEPYAATLFSDASSASDTYQSLTELSSYINEGYAAANNLDTASAGDAAKAYSLHSAYNDIRGNAIQSCVYYSMPNPKPFVDFAKKLPSLKPCSFHMTQGELTDMHNCPADQEGKMFYTTDTHEIYLAVNGNWIQIANNTTQ